MADSPPSESASKKSKKSKKTRDEDEEAGLQSDPEVAEEEPKKKKARRQTTEKSADQKKKEELMNARAHKKASGYRKLATRAGYSTKAGRNGTQGFDPAMSVLTVDDAKRLMRFFPEVTNKSSYGQVEAYERMQLCEEPVPKSAARTAQAHLETVFRWAMNKALLNAIENDRRNVDAIDMYRVLRHLEPSLKYTAVLPPKGLIKHVLSSNLPESLAELMKPTEEDVKGEQEEKKANAKIAQKFTKHKAAIQAQKDAEKQEREENKKKNSNKQPEAVTAE